MTEQPPPPTRSWLWGVAAVLLLLAGAGVAAEGTPRTPAAAAAAGPAAPSRVVYEVDGDAATARVTWTADAVHRDAAAALPWRLEAALPPGALPALTAENTGGGSVTCRIVLDGVLVAQLTSFDPFGVVDCAPDRD